jgi:hypothetical protein
MITTRITVKPHLREYVIAKFCNFDGHAPVHFPSHADIYHLVWDWLVRRPVNAQVDAGNLEIVLPRRDAGKHPMYYNYLSPAAQKAIERKIEQLMWAEFHEFVDARMQSRDVTCIEAISDFIGHYAINSLTEDAFRKNYYRWRLKIRSSKTARRSAENEKNLCRQTARFVPKSAAGAGFAVEYA